MYNEKITNKTFIYTCRKCKQKIRVPDNEEVSIRCINCKEETTIYSYD